MDLGITEYNEVYYIYLNYIILNYFVIIINGVVFELHHLLHY